MKENQQKYQSVKEKISKAGLKSTQQRIVIYDAMLAMHIHPTAETIYEKVQVGNPSISLGTVYKTLDTLVEAGLVKKVFTDEGNMRYDANTGYHNHIYCTNTKEIIDYYNEELSLLLEDFFNKRLIRNLRIKDISLQINAEKIDPHKDIEII